MDVRIETYSLATISFGLTTRRLQRSFQGRDPHGLGYLLSALGQHATEAVAFGAGSLRIGLGGDTRGRRSVERTRPLAGDAGSGELSSGDVFCELSEFRDVVGGERHTGAIEEVEEEPRYALLANG